MIIVNSEMQIYANIILGYKTAPYFENMDGKKQSNLLNVFNQASSQNNLLKLLFLVKALFAIGYTVKKKCIFSMYSLFCNNLY